MEHMKKTGCLLFLYFLARQDYRSREVSSGVLYLFLGVGMFLWMIQGSEMRWQLPVDLFPGCVLLLAGVVSKEQIGYGDGLAVLAAGVWTGGVFVLYAMTLGFWLAAGCILVGRLRKGCVDEQMLQVPYLPFFLIGMVVMTGVS